MRLIIPAGAVGTDTLLSVEVGEDGTGKALSDAYTVRPSDVFLSIPALAEIDMPEGALLPRSTGGDSPVIAQLRGGLWTALSVQRVGSQMLSGQVDGFRFRALAVVGREAISSDGPPPDDLDAGTPKDSDAGTIDAGSHTGGSCLQIREADPSAPDGTYDIVVGDRSYPLYCDMTTDGGGWTLVHKTDQSSVLDRTDAGFNEAALATSALDDVAVLSRRDIATIGSTFRVVGGSGTQRLFWRGWPYYTTDRHYEIPIGQAAMVQAKSAWSDEWVNAYEEGSLPQHGPCIRTPGSTGYICIQRYCCGEPNAGVWFEGFGATAGRYDAATGLVR